MRSSAGRTDKYRKKLRALVLPGQTDRYSPTAADRLHLEYCVKKEAITPMLQFSYVAFCEELIKHEANKRPEEATGIYNKWLNRGLDATTLQSVASCIGVSIEIPAPPECLWLWKRKLTFTGNVSGTNLDDFPILVHLTVANFDFAKAKTNGEDIRFMDSDTCPSDGTPLKHEIEYWSQGSQEAWVWVKVPRINGGTVNDFIYMFYGNAAAADGQDAPSVWSNNYMVVLHMRGDGTNILPDSLATYNFTKKAIGEPANAHGFLDGFQQFDGVNDYATQTTLLDAGSAAWHMLYYFKPRSVPVPDEYLFAKVNVPGTDLVEGDFLTGTQQFRVTIRGAGNAELRAIKVAWNVQPYQFDLNLGTGGIEIYIDGTLDNSNAQTNSPGPGTSTDFWLAAHPNDVLHAYIDIYEFRVSSSRRSSDWIQAQYRSMVETLITYGAEEPGG